MLRPYFFRCTFPRHVTPAAMADLTRSLRLFDGLAMVVGIMVGSGVFRTPGFVAGWVESVGMYTAAIAASGVAAAEFLVRLTGWDRASLPWLCAGLVALFTAVNLIGVASGRWVQNLVTAAKVLA